MATFQSHRKCWQEILDQGLEAALIIEDDVDIIDAEFTAAVKLAMKEIKMGDLIRFPIKLREKPRNKLWNEITFQSLNQLWWVSVWWRKL